MGDTLVLGTGSESDFSNDKLINTLARAGIRVRVETEQRAA
jgi:hypothetical protein